MQLVSRLVWAFRGWSTRAILVGMAAGWCSSALAQLRITEVMYNTSATEPKWEWIEVRNMTGAPLDLDGYYYADIGKLELPVANLLNVSSGGSSANTVIPAGGLGVIFNGPNLDFDEQRFRNAWQLGGSVPLIGVASPPQLANGGDAFGIWSSAADYMADLADTDMDGDFETAQFANAVTSLDYQQTDFPFPDTGNGNSMSWNGMGNYMEGPNWSVSENGVAGAVTSVQTFLQSTQINSTDDTGNPGVIAGGTAPTGIFISEIMYNPRSTEADWEWVEIYNNTGVTIDFAATPYTLDDDDLAALDAPNVNSGSIANGETAVLYNDVISPQNIADAWGADGNYIGVDSWPALANNGDTVGLWSDFTAYQMDRMDDPFTGGRADSVVAYLSDGVEWPIDDGMGSIHLSPIDGDPSTGTSWQLSTAGDELSFNAMAVIGTEEDHLGGDVGSPGSFPGSSGPPCDFDGDGACDLADLDALTMELSAGGTNLTFDVNNDGMVNDADLDAWLMVAGEENLGPGRSYLFGDANLDAAVDVSDFNEWNNNKFTTTGKWSQGDFNADGSSDVSDFNAWNMNKFQSADSVRAVPEPGGVVLLVWAVAAVITFCRSMRW